MLQIYNTLTHKKELFHPLSPGKMRIYVCGMTVYDYCHIGHGRVLVAFDVMTRYLRAKGWEVTYVRNITDIDDKIIQRARDNQESCHALTERFIQAMYDDTAALGVLNPDHEPRATQYIPQMIVMVQTLLEKGYAYIADNGDVYYEVAHFEQYGCLAHQDLEKLRAGARVAISEAKREPLDFVLWKMAKPDEPSWDSPWGKGRPGWHIECSAMAMDLLGKQLDIHGGGFDLIFPHHENEIAQSEAVTDKRFVNTWMHVGFVQVNQEKMSKSLGNFFTIREVLAQYAPEVVRYFLVASHYRSQLNYSAESLDSARHALERLYLTLRGLPEKTESTTVTEFEQRFNEAMDDDFNTPNALAVLFDLAREINRVRDETPQKAAELAGVLRRLGGILGLLQQSPETFLQSGISEQQAKIQSLIDARNQARKTKQWAEADRVRDQLLQMGVILEDTPHGTIWRKV